jgi:tetratricopeptide (TPR) repeat protein
MRAAFSILMAAGGLLFFLLGLCLPWFALPVGFDSNGSLVLRDAPATLWWKCACLAVIAATLAWMIFRKKRGGLHGKLAALFAAMLPFLIWYPQAVIVMDETTSGDAAWLQQQFDNLTWLGGDIYRGHSERPVADGMGLWAQDPPNRLAAFRPPMAGSFSLGIADLPDLVWWLGYNPAFSQFAARGWFLCVSGMALLLTGSFAWGQRGSLRGQRRDLMRGTAFALAASSAAVLLLSMLPVTLGGRALRQARESAISWQPEAALRDLQSACERMPALRLDSGVIYQRGSLLRQLGRTEEASAKLHEAWLLSDKGYGPRSTVLLEELIAMGDTLTVSERREALRGLLREAINDINSNRLSEAKRKFRMVLDANPVCMQGWFHYQLVGLQSGDIAANRLAAARVEAISKAYVRKEKRGIVAASQAMLAQGETRAGNTEAAVAARRKSQGR